MAKTITITDIEFNSVQLWTVTDEAGTHIMISLQFNYLANGEKYQRTYVNELAGARRTQVVTFLQNLKADIISAEGI